MSSKDKFIPIQNLCIKQSLYTIYLLLYTIYYTIYFIYIFTLYIAYSSFPRVWESEMCKQHKNQVFAGSNSLAFCKLSSQFMIS